MDRAKLESLDDDQRFYERINDSTTKSVLDFLIDHPEKRYDGAALVTGPRSSSASDSRSTRILRD